MCRRGIGVQLDGAPKSRLCARPVAESPADDTKKVELRGREDGGG